MFDRILDLVAAPCGAGFVDVGCGPGFHAMRLAPGISRSRGGPSDAALEQAARNVRQAGLEEQIRLSRQDVLALRMTDGQAPYLLCWGVFMHIPKVSVR